MALWEAPITAMVLPESEGIILARSGGLRAGSRPISSTEVTGRGLVVGADPVQRTRRLDDTLMGSDFSSLESILTFQ